ncbi:adenylate cyclase [Leptospira broomii serovar Hurstbridge str. 5399]|uniref:Adenylate cyclase n=1 Tax=Leptospira broomii serovar Hurstbridge str. 5399 TaxID=1049789 RepID=T0F0Q3_9LEPT|nr:CYTH domain-containing protein [Leptospira broomii]EQA44735.1 adenylate cyclase [Leptospira broomii serovar Hurstbridge str. 5399]
MEIERKFLVCNEEYKKLAQPEHIVQGYLNSDKSRTVRVRLKEAKGFITIKSVTVGISREEFEYEIPNDDARQILENICEKPILEKNRYSINYRGSIWEIDEFLGDNQGLVVAEIELDDPKQLFEKPDWIGKEVSDDPRYFNSSLIKNPFKTWK